MRSVDYTKLGKLPVGMLYKLEVALDAILAALGELGSPLAGRYATLGEAT